MKVPLRKVVKTTKSTYLSGSEKITFFLECNHEITRRITPRMKHPRKMRCRMCEAIAHDADHPKNTTSHALSVQQRRPAMTPAQRLAAKKPARKAKPPPGKPIMKCTMRLVRMSLHLSLRDVSEEIGMAVANIHRIELGGEVQLTTARKLAKFYGKSIDELWPEK